MSKILYIVMPAYNEEEIIEDVVRAWYPMVSLGESGSKLVVADSGSTDHTHEILVKLQSEFPQLMILDNTLKQHGPKLIALYNTAIAENADFVFQTDSDGQTNPDEFRLFWNQIDNYDVVMGYRKKRGDGTSRALVEKTVCMLLRFIFGVKVPDANAPFRLMKTAVLEKYMNRFEADYNIPNIMLTTWFAYYKERMLFLDISFKPRKTGVNSINLSKIVRIGWNAIHDFKEFKKEMND